MDIKRRTQVIGTTGLVVAGTIVVAAAVAAMQLAATPNAVAGDNLAAGYSATATETAAAYLSLQRNPRDVTIAALAEATTSVAAVIYKFDDPAMVAPLRAAMGRGVRIQVLLDGKEAAKKKSQAVELVLAGAEVRVWPQEQGKLHAKFVIIDGARTLTGSYNWTRSGGDDNVELLVVDTDRELVAALQEHFVTLWAKSDPIAEP